MHINALARLGTIFLAACLSTSSAFATNFPVTDQASLNAAIIFSNLTTTNDTITLQNDISLIASLFTGSFGPDSVTPIGPKGGASITVQSSAGNHWTLNRAPTVAGTLYRIFEVIAGGNLILQNVTLQNGNPGAFDGGAVLVDAGASLNVTGNTLFNANNSGANGGAIAISLNATAGNISDTIFSGNTATTSGGAVAIFGTATLITRSEFSANSAGSAGAIVVGGTLTTLSDSNLFNNSASTAAGGAIWVEFGGVLTNILNTNFTDNSVPVGGGGFGGAIAVSGLVGVIDGSDFINGSATFGGAIWIGDAISPALASAGHVNSIHATLLKGNTASTQGGAIFAAQANSPTHTTVIDAITLSRFEENIASVASGGAIYLQTVGIALINTTTFEANGGGVDPNAAAVGGGAIALNVADLGTVSNSLFDLNVTLGQGGAILLLKNDVGASTIQVLENSTFSGDTAGSFGGAISFALDTNTVHTLQVPPRSIIVYFTNNTVADCVAGISGGGIFLGAENNDGTIFNFWSSLVAQNRITGGGDGPDVANDAGNPITNEAYNLIGNNSGSTFIAGLPNANKSFVGTAAAPIDPRIGPLANNGGPTETRALLTTTPASIAIDHGANPLLLLYDQRGPNFLRTSGPQTDIGAFEVQQACPDCRVCPVCPRKECSKCHKDHDHNEGNCRDNDHDHDNDPDDDRHGHRDHDWNHNDRDEDGIVSKGRAGRGPRALSAVPSTAAPAVAAAPSVSVEARQIKQGDAGSTTGSNADSLEQAGGCSSIGGVGQSSTNLTLILLSLLAGLRAIRSKKAKGLLQHN